MDERWGEVMRPVSASASATKASGLSHYLVVLIATFIGYVVVAQAGFLLVGQALLAGPFRPTSGLSLAALTVFGLGVWPAVLAASFAVTLGITHDPILSAVIAGGHTLGAVAAAMLVNRFANGRDVFRSVRDTLRATSFVFVTALVPATATALAAQRHPELATGWASFFGSWLGQVIGTLVFAPCVLTVISDRAHRVPHQRRALAESISLQAGLTMVTLVVFAGFVPSEVKTYPLEFFCLPFLLWAAYRFGTREVVLSVGLVSSVAVWGTVRGIGPFASGGPNEWLLQAYIAVTSITGMAFATAVDERRRAEAQLQELAATDALTGLVNYRRLLEVLRHEMARSRRTGRTFALLLVDMDGLKRINDRLGHLAGSRAICRVADVLRHCTRETDVVSRFGGDEFAVVLPESGDDGGVSVLGRVARRLKLDGVQPALSVSGGHAVFPRDGDSPTLLLRAADQRLYAAKHGQSAQAAAPELAAIGA
jgi:diguanylate cyclase (GGDEF)-like protein